MGRAQRVSELEVGVRWRGRVLEVPFPHTQPPSPAELAIPSLLGLKSQMSGVKFGSKRMERAGNSPSLKTTVTSVYGEVTLGRDLLGALQALSQQSHEVVGNNPILKMKKRRFREGYRHAQGHTASDCESRYTGL